MTQLVKKQTRVLIATGIYPPDIGGPATYSKLLYEELPKRGIAVKVLNFGEVRHFPKIFRHLLYFFKSIIRGYNCHIIYAQDPVSVGLPAMLAAKILGKKFILKIVGDYAWEQGTQRYGVKDLLDVFATKYLEYPFFVKFFKNIEYRVAKGARVIVVPSYYLRRIVSGWGIGKEKIKVIYNSFDAPGINLSKKEARAKLGLGGSVLVSAGRLVPWKGFSTLIEIMPRIIKEIPDARLYIIGEGPDSHYLQTKISNLSLERSVTLTGKLPQKVLHTYLLAGDIFALNTAYEGFSHQVLEAMALGIPVITTTSGGNAEVVDNAVNGVLVEYNDKPKFIESILTLLRGEETRSNIILEAKKKALSFSEERMINEIADILACL